MTTSYSGTPAASSSVAPSQVEHQDTASHHVLVVIQQLDTGVLRTAFILGLHQDANIESAFGAINRFYKAQPDCTTATQVVGGQPATWAASQGVTHADIVFLDESAWVNYADVIDAGLDLIDRDAEEMIKLQARLVRLSAVATTTRGQSANVTMRRPLGADAANLLGGFGNVTASVGGDRGAGIPLQVDAPYARGALATGHDDVSSMSAAPAYAAAGGRPAFAARSVPRGGSAPLPHRQYQPLSAQAVGMAASAPSVLPLQPAPAPGGGGGGGSVGGGGGDGGGGVGGGGGGSVASVVSVDIDIVNKVHRGLQQAFQGASPITSLETYMAFLCTYKLQGNVWLSVDVDISLHTMDGDRTVFASTPQNKVWGAVWFSILSPLCKKGGNPLAARMDRMINRGDQGAEALAELQTYYMGNSTTLTSLQNLDRLLFMSRTKEDRTQFVIKMTDLMDSLELQIDTLEFSQIIRVFLCLRALDRPFVKKLREVMMISKEEIEGLDIERLKSLITQQESLGIDFASQDSKSPSSNHSDSSDSPPLQGWAAGIAILSRCERGEKEEKWKQSLKGAEPCLFCFPSSSAKAKETKHAAGQCPLLRALGYTVVGCDEKGRPSNTMAKLKEIDSLKKDVASLRAQLKTAKAASANKATAEKKSEEEVPLSGFPAVTEEVAEDKKWSEVVAHSSGGSSPSAGAFDELDLA